jgi:hypothetical protein
LQAYYLQEEVAMKKPRSEAAERSPANALGPVRSMRRGVLTERRITCSKPGCPCGHDPDARHGPYFSLTRKVERRTRTRLVRPELAAVVRRQIEEGRVFRTEVEAYWQACERHANDELEALHAGQAEGAEKGGFRRRSPRRLRPRSPG